jgi:hypothetical protein
MTLTRVRDGAFCLLFTLLMVAMQYHSGAFTADLAFDSDEPAHAVSSLFVRDYLAQAFPHNPLKFASMFYAHYPKIAIGHWPPLFYCGEAIWMLLAGRSQVALLLFVALCGAALVSSIYFEVERRSSTAAALLSVSVLMSSSIFQQMLCGVHPDLLLALMVLWAAVYCGDFMAFGKPRSRNLFLAFGVAALLVHGRGGIVLLLPFWLLPLQRRTVRWKWLAAGLAVLLIMLLVPHAIHAASAFSLYNVLFRAHEFIAGIFFLTSWLGMLLALLGLALVLRRDRQQPFWLAMAGLVVCGLVFYVLVPVPFDHRYLITTLPAVAVLAGGGVQVLLDGISKAGTIRRTVLSVAIGTAALAWMIATTVGIQTKPDHGYRRMIANCLLCGNEVTLIAGDAINEGGMIAEASLSDPMRVHTVLRASKALAHSDWSRNYTELYFSSPSEVEHFLDQAHVSQIVVQDGCQNDEDIQLRAVLGQQSSEWQRAPEISSPEGIEIYRRIGSN